MHMRLQSSFFFFFNDTATTEIYTLSLHDALPIFHVDDRAENTFLLSGDRSNPAQAEERGDDDQLDRKSTRLNSSHLVISYAVFCLKKKKKKNTMIDIHPKLINIYVNNPLYNIVTI